MSLAASRQVLRHSRFAVRRVALRNASTTSEAAGAAKEKAGQATSKASEGLSKVQSSAGSAMSKAGSMGSAAMNRLGALGGRTGQFISFVQYHSRKSIELSSGLYSNCAENPQLKKLTGSSLTQKCPFIRIPGNGGKTSHKKLTASIAALIPPTVYYSRVGLELGKIVFQHRGMSLPSQQAFMNYMQPLINAVKNPSAAFSQTSVSTSTFQPTNVLSNVRNMSQAQVLSAGVVAAEVIGFFSVGEIIGRMKITGYRSSAPAHH
ncbi:hypothetical protein K490DRAFT_62266 [Saccharata proteae CBS 121410]|uniref:Mitochondrial F1F0-ATP synthase g subunit n=1 Tax=Saccharata proteae CBS 121410 TaxID=1314787 RepID=A0A9P4I1Q8_9PEZI|nr:hypothetical protein K490DRAFT_62266 [Saccharata proteae CBS 121410]